MSLTNPSSNPNKMHKNSFHCRNDSGELDVFEAARYFSSSSGGGGNDQNPAFNFSQKFIRDDHHRQYHQHHQTAARMSLDIPKSRKPIILPAEYHHVMDQKQILKDQKKKYKQPSSPGGRLASFLNSLFSQTSLKKKKSKSGNKDFDDESPGGRRKRRSSISHFRITNSANSNINNNNYNNNASANDTAKSGFQTPPPYANTPTKSYKEFISILPKNSEINFKPTSLLNEINAEKTAQENSRVPGNFVKNEKNSRFSYRKSTTNCDDLLHPLEKRDYGKFSDPDDGADSDSSSDLFDLPNHELDFYSSSLPVYETTHMDRIKIAAPISRATTV